MTTASRFLFFLFLLATLDALAPDFFFGNTIGGIVGGHLALLALEMTDQ